MAANLPGCDKDDLVHFAANGKLKIHLLTDNLTFAKECSSHETVCLPKIVQIGDEYFHQLEAGVDDAVFCLTIPNPDGSGHLIFGHQFKDIWGDEIRLTKFVILHSELMKVVKKPI